MNTLQQIERINEEVTGLRREFHIIPEIAFHERETSRRIADYLENWGYKVKRGVGKTGVVATLKEENIGPVLVLRVDIDGLPVQERTGLSFSSKNNGVMHACGHDIHIAIALGVARIFSLCREEINGNLKFVFQPAEEILSGARAMLEDDPNLLSGVKAIFGLHNWPYLEVGTIGIKRGVLMAGADEIEIILEGIPGHGALPEKTVDPVVMAGEIIISLQTLISREIPSEEQAVISICSINGGSSSNIIPDRVELKGTMRTVNQSTRDYLLERIETITAAITGAFGGGYSFKIIPKVPPMINDEVLAYESLSVLKDKFNPDKVKEIEKPTMVSEDFSILAKKVPGLYLLIGTGTGIEKGIGLHHPQYVANEEILSIGVKAICEVLLYYLL